MTTQSYICHLTLYIWHYIHCISVIKPKVSIVLHPLSVWHYTLYVWHNFQYAWHHMNNLWHHTCKVWHQSTIFMIYQIYMISPIMCHENKTNISGISPTVFDITATASCGHTHSINAFTKIMEFFTLGTIMTSYTLYITLNSDFMTSIVSI